MFLLNIFRDFWKALGILLILLFVGSFITLLKPTEEDKYLDQQMKMYPLGFHGYDENNEKVIMKVDMKSKLSLSTDNKTCKYTMKNALYKNNDKKLFGCEILIEQNGIQNSVIVYIDDEKISDFSSIRYEPSEDKDLIYQVVHKVVKKKQYEKIHMVL